MIGLKTTLNRRYHKKNSKRAFVILLLFFVFLSCPEEEETVQAPVRTETDYVVKKGENIEAILDNILSDQATTTIINAMKSAGFPFRKCLPGDSIKILTESGFLSKFIYSQSLTTEYYIENNNQHLFVSMKFPYIDTAISLLRGEVNSTLYESVLDLGETPLLVYRFTDIFAWEVDFVTDTRNGDSFYVYLEKTHCDSVFVDYLKLSAARYKGEVGEYTGIYYRDPDGYEDYYNLKGQSLRKSLLKSPLRYSYISSYFSKRRFHPILKVWRPHHGLDYKAPRGTPVSTIGDGIVTFKGWKGAYGNLVEIRHKNNFKSRYGHLSKYAKGVYKGKRVKMGQLIGYVGSTGLSTGPHLHFELLRNGVAINPLKVKIPRAPSVKKKHMSDFEQHRDSLMNTIEHLLQDRGEEISIN